MAGMPDLPSLLERIAILMDEQPGAAPGRLLEVMEHTLTDGYAYALGLEAEGLRLERDISAAVVSLEAGEPAEGLGGLTDRQGEIVREIGELRERLRVLRQRVDVIRRAALAA
jgi:hypothetical protein